MKHKNNPRGSKGRLSRAAKLGTALVLTFSALFSPVLPLSSADTMAADKTVKIMQKKPKNYYPLLK